MSGRTWTIEMMWDCSHCGTRNPGMKGSERESLKCSNCGGEKTNEPWVMPDSPATAPHLTGELDRKARAGANWTCTYCKGESREGHTACEVCGADRYPVDPRFMVGPTHVETAVAAPSPAVVKKAQEPTAPKAPKAESLEEALSDIHVKSPVEGGYRAPSYMAPPRRPDPIEDDEPAAPSWFSTIDTELVFKLVLGVGSAVLFVWLMVWLFTPNTTVTNVDSMTWNRERILQERHNYAGEGWRTQAPSGVYSWDHCETRQNGTENCHPHDCNCRDVSYECNCTGGNSYECNCTTSSNCSTSCSSNSNGSATCRERCSPTRSCSTCTTPRVCQTCSRRECSTCYDQCPVYAEWCSYHYHQWDQLSQARTAGRGHGAVWPDLDVRGPLQRILSSEEYTVRFTDTRSDRTWVKTYSFSAYERFNISQHWNTEWTRAGGFTLLGIAR